MHASLPYKWCPCDCNGGSGVIHWLFPEGDREEKDNRSRGLDECPECGAVWTCYDVERAWLFPDEKDPRYRRGRD